MAGGTIKSSTGTNLEIRIDWSAISHTASNSSTVSCDVYLEHYSIYSSGLSGSYIRIGQSVYPFSAAVNRSQNSYAVTKIASFSCEVSHAFDGSCTVEIGAGWRFNGVYSGVSIGMLEASETVYLDKIARASTAAFDRTSFYAGGEIGLRITRHDPSFKHKLQLTVGDAYIYSGFLSGTSPVWTVPESLAGGVTGALSAPAAAVLHTYDSEGTWIASSDAGGLTMKIPDSESFRPEFTLSLSSYSPYSVISSNGIYAAGISGVKVFVTGAAAKHGAFVSGCTVRWGGRSISGVAEDGACTLCCPLETSGNIDVTVEVKDSRGLSRTNTVRIVSQSYGAPALKDVSVYRCDSAGEAKDGGGSIFAKAAAFVSPVCGGNFENSGAMNIKITSRADGVVLYQGDLCEEGGVFASGLSPLSSYDVLISLTDGIGKSTSYFVTVPTSKIDFHLKDGSARFGGYCERDGFECDWDASFGGRVSIKGSEVNDFVCGSGTDGIWTWRKWNSGVAECFGITEKKSVVLSEKFGSLYISSATDENRNSVLFPAGLFIDTPAVWAAPCHKEYTYFISPRGNATSEASADYYIIGENPDVSYTVSLSLHAIGKWK